MLPRGYPVHLLRRVSLVVLAVALLLAGLPVGAGLRSGAGWVAGAAAAVLAAGVVWAVVSNGRLRREEQGRAEGTGRLDVPCRVDGSAR